MSKEYDYQVCITQLDATIELLQTKLNFYMEQNDELRDENSRLASEVRFWENSALNGKSN